MAALAAAPFVPAKAKPKPVPLAIHQTAVRPRGLHHEIPHHRQWHANRMNDWGVPSLWDEAREANAREMDEIIMRELERIAREGYGPVSWRERLT
jgi:hypothetical protein